MKIFFNAFIRKLAYICAASLVALLVHCTNAHADYTPPVIYKAKSPFTGEWSTMQLACEGTAPQHATSLNRTFVNVTYCQMSSINGLVSYNFTNSNGSNQQVNADTFLKTQTCAQGQNIVGGSAANGNLVCSGNPPPPTCTPPQILNQAATACENPPNPCEVGTGTKINSLFYTGSTATTLCRAGCELYINNSVCVSTGECSADTTITGNQCTPTPDNPETQQPTPEHECVKQGKSYGTVNGVTVCVKNGTESTPPLTTNSTGSKSTTNANGTTTTNTTRNENNDKVITTTTITNPDGTTTTETTEQDKQGFCELNPNSPNCKPKNDICETDPTIPACQHWCDQPENQDKLACMSEGDDLTDTINDLETQEINFNVAPRSGIPSMSGCPAPETVSVGFVTIPLSYDAICTYAEPFRYLLIVFSWLGVAYIVYQVAIKES